jgi:hypothetical protein
MNTGDRAPSVSGFGAEPGALTDVVFDRYVGYSNRAIATAAGIAFFFMITLIAILVPGGFATRFGVCCAVALGAVLLVGSSRQKRAQTMAQHAVAAVARDGIASAMRGLLDSAHGMAVATTLHAALSLLAGQGKGGTTLRICRAAEMVELEPLTYPFEPQPLNEMQSVLIRQQSANGEHAPGQAASAARSFARNVALKGGWFILVIVGFDWVWALKESIVRRAITWQLMAFSLALLMLAFMPARWGTRQWYVVPSALVLRKSGWWQRRWRLELFERCHSVLCVSHWTRNIWSVTVANARTSVSRDLTRTEAGFLLRAWLSPLSPPPIERLVDLQ